MIAESTRAADPAALAAEVRSLAPTAYRLLTGPDPSAVEVRAAMRRVARLYRRCRVAPDAGLSRWLSAMHRRLSALAPAGSPSAP